MSRKFAAFIATGVALVIVGGALLVLALGHERQPHPAAATTQTSPPPPPATTPTSEPTETPTNAAPPSTPGRPAADPTAALVKGKNKKVLFFSFDDGPDPYWTPKI